MAHIEIRQFGLHLHAAEGMTLLDCFRQEGLDIVAPCGGKGLCKQCKVLAAGSSESTPETVLACQTRVEGDVAVTIPERTLFAPLQGMVSGTLETVQERTGQDAGTGRKAGLSLGLAVDIGTTTIAAYLADLDTGAILGAAGLINPQIVYGTEIIARLEQALNGPAHARLLQQHLTGAMEELIVRLCRSAGAYESHRVKEIVVVGNTAMHHLLLNADIRRLARSPFVPAVLEDITIKASDLGISVCADASVTLPGPVASFIGSDHMAALYATGFIMAKGTVLLLDIGTNTEISLVTEGAVSCVSCASGGAFEGHSISSGMTAGPGAIDHVTIEGNELKFHTIGDSEPVGICGSGIFDLLAQMVSGGVIDTSGRFSPDHPLVKRGQKNREFILVAEEGRRRPISVTQEDVRALQLAKAAISTGIRSLLKESGLQGSDVAEVILAGGFGSYLDVRSAVTIGMLPDIPLERYRQVGNAAGVGARHFLLSQNARTAWQRMKERVRYHELVSIPGFRKRFLSELSLQAWH